MQTFARIAGGVVAELIEIPDGTPPLHERYHPDLVAAMIEVPEGAEVAEGWAWDGEAFASPPPAPVMTPVSVTARQARLALHMSGLLEQVEAAVAAAGGATQIEWEHATTIERASPLVIGVAAALDPPLSEAQLDALFSQAATL